MRMKTSVAIAVFVLAGCASLSTVAHNDRAQYIAAQTAFTGVVNALAELREAGTFTASDADKITKVIHVGKTALSAWADALLEGNDPADARAKALNAIRDLNDWRMK